MITSPALDVLQRERDVVAADIERMSDELKFARAKLKSLNQAIDLLAGSLPATGRSRDQSMPTLKELIVEKLSQQELGRTPAEIAGILTEAGRATGNTTVSSILSRLRKEGAAEKRGNYWYLSGTSIDAKTASVDQEEMSELTEPPDDGTSDGPEVSSVEASESNDPTASTSFERQLLTGVPADVTASATGKGR